jgi:hypothetical protein
MGAAKVIVSDYRYFLFTIYDMRFTQLADVMVVKVMDMAAKRQKNS